MKSMALYIPAALFCLVALPSIGDDQKPDARETVHITYLYLQSGTGDHASTSKQLQSWFTTSGERHDNQDGTTTIFRYRDRLLVNVNPELRSAREIRFGDSATSWNPVEVSRGMGDFKRIAEAVRLDEARKEPLLGYECDVTALFVRTPEGGSIRTSTWTAEIGGFTIELKNRRETTSPRGVKDVVVREAIRVDLRAEAPKHLLDIPRGYKVTPLDANVKEALDAALKAMRKASPPK